MRVRIFINGKQVEKEELREYELDHPAIQRTVSEARERVLGRRRREEA